VVKSSAQLMGIVNLIDRTSAVRPLCTPRLSRVSRCFKLARVHNLIVHSGFFLISRVLFFFATF